MFLLVIEGRKRSKILSKFFYSPTDAQVNCLKKYFEIYIIINTKRSLTCFGAVTPSSGSALFVLDKVTLVKIAFFEVSHPNVYYLIHIYNI